MATHGADRAVGHSDGPAATLFGVFAAIARLGGTAVPVSGVYDGLLADLHAGRERADDPDLGFFTAQVARFGGPVLELGCGAGRVALPLARAGHEVVAVDRSVELLSRLRERLAAEPATARRVTVQEADLLQETWPPRFRLVIVSAVMLPTFLAAGGEPWLRRVAAAIAPGGALCFDGEPPRPPLDGEFLSTRTAEHPGGPVAVTQGFRMVDDPPGHELNVYAEQRQPDGTLRCQLGVERIVALPTDLEETLARCGFGAIDRVAWDDDDAGTPHSVGWVAETLNAC